MTLRHSTHFKSTSEFSVSLFSMVNRLRQEIETHISTLSDIERSEDKADILNQALPTSVPDWQQCPNCRYDYLLGACIAVLGEMIGMEKPYPSFMKKEAAEEINYYLQAATKIKLLELIAQDDKNPLAKNVKIFLDEYDTLSKVPANSAESPATNGFKKK